MHRSIREHWPEAPIVDWGARWVRLRPLDGGLVYVQRYAWDDDTRPHYLVAWQRGDGGADQVRYTELADAVADARFRCELPFASGVTR